MRGVLRFLAVAVSRMLAFAGFGESTLTAETTTPVVEDGIKCRD
jgi:hypothetical protein